MVTYYIHNPPDLLHAGGVAIYTRNTSTAFKRTDVNTTDEFETILVEIVNTKAKYILCCCAYRHPSFNPVRFKEQLESTLSQLVRENKTIFIMVILMLNSYFLLPCISQTTRITERSATSTNNMFSITYAMNATSSNLASKISDHLPQFLIVDNRKINYKC